MEPQELDPDKLIQLARNGDQSAQGELLERVRRAVKAIAGRLLGRRSSVDASDVAQVVDEKVLQSFQGFHGRTFKEYCGWVYQIAVNTCLDLGKKRQIPVTDVGASDSSSEFCVPDSSSAPSEKVARRELYLVALSLLPDRERRVVELWSKGTLYEEIARELGESPVNCRQIKLRAIESLRRHLADGPEESANAS